MTAAASSEGVALSVSVVTYYSDPEWLKRTFVSLSVSIVDLQENFPRSDIDVVVVNNGGADPLGLLQGVLPPGSSCRSIGTGQNVGYGRGHNAAIDLARSQFHLILNPDVQLERNSLSTAIKWMREQPHAVAIAPDVFSPSGHRAYLCRRLPGVRVLLLRAFAPTWLRLRCATLLGAYEMRDLVDGSATVWDPPLISGCFMLFRTDVIRLLKGFDPRYFLYFEDYDLSLRAARFGRLAYVPAVRICHAGGGAASKGWKHTLLFCRSAFRFFALHGWRW